MKPGAALLRSLAAFSLVLVSVLLSSSGAEDRDQVYVRKFLILGYPPMARQARVQGSVTAKIHLDEEGNVLGVSDVRGPALLIGITSVLDQWRFVVPQKKSTTIGITFRFSLSGPERPDNVALQISGDLPRLIEIVTNPTSEKPGPDVVPVSEKPR